MKDEDEVKTEVQTAETQQHERVDGEYNSKPPQKTSAVTRVTVMGTGHALRSGKESEQRR